MSELLIRSVGLHAIKPLTFREGLPLRAGLEPPGGSPAEPTPEQLSYMGTPVLYPLTLTVGSVDLYIPDVLQTMTREKRVVTTPVQGRKAPVHELYAQGGWSVSVDGLLVGENGEFPGDKLRRLLQITEAEEPVTVTSDFMRLYGIFSAVITSERHKQLAGFENLITFSLELSEDILVDLIEEL